MQCMSGKLPCESTGNMAKNDNLAVNDREDMIGWNCGLTGSLIIYMDPPILLESFGKSWMSIEKEHVYP